MAFWFCLCRASVVVVFVVVAARRRDDEARSCVRSVSRAFVRAARRDRSFVASGKIV